MIHIKVLIYLKDLLTKFRSTYISSKENPAVYSIIATVEAIITIIFTFDYFIHFYKAKNKIKFLLLFHSILDLLMLVPYYIHVLVKNFDSALGFLNILQIFRLLRIIRLFRYIYN